ncbi:MAG TPA: AraC family transcriptional regulator [Chitinophagaceae bacterium]|nr:AraC family transcriptional regulator [Chitinophagaceae bacterium]
MFSLYDDIKKNPIFYRQLSCGDTLISKYDCPLETKFADTWSHFNYIIYVIEGRKIWHTAHGSYDLTTDKCVLVRKGAAIIEQFFDTRFCLVMFFLPDDFIRDVLKSRKTPLYKPGKKFDPIIPIDNNASVKAFFESMMHHFSGDKIPDPSLLELKFRELVLTLAENPNNTELLSYFSSLLSEPQALNLQKIMEDNFCFNLKLEEFARLSNRSLSAFKRDFQKVFGTTPGKWLIEKRLSHSMHLLTNQNKSVSEAAFEVGFESPSHFSRAFRNHFGYSPATMKQR